MNSLSNSRAGRDGLFASRLVQLAERTIYPSFFAQGDLEKPEGSKEPAEGGQGSGDPLLDGLGGTAGSCPACRRPDSKLRWMYFEDPERAWDELGDDAGWIVVCTGCDRQVDSFTEANV